jgi:hypothetical protein
MSWNVWFNDPLHHEHRGSSRHDVLHQARHDVLFRAFALFRHTVDAFPLQSRTEAQVVRLAQGRTGIAAPPLVDKVGFPYQGPAQGDIIGSAGGNQVPGLVQGADRTNRLGSVMPLICVMSNKSVICFPVSFLGFHVQVILIKHMLRQIKQSFNHQKKPGPQN